MSPFSDGEEWFRHDSLALIDVTDGATEPYAELPAADDVANGVVFASGAAYGPSGQTVFWQDGDSWVGVDAVNGSEAAVPEVLWISKLELEDLEDLMAGAERTSWLRGVRYEAVSSSDGAAVEVPTEAIPSFIGPTQQGWTVWIDSTGKLGGFETR